MPVPGPKAIYVRELFEDLGVLQNGKWNERYLCFSPQERLFLYGRWQEGIEPAVGLKPRDREQFQGLEEHFTRYRNSGEFTIPLELGRSNRSADLDRITFADWLSQQGFDSLLVNWYVNYACRDDYGSLAKDTSAWPAFTISLPGSSRKRPAHLARKATAGLPVAYSNASAKRPHESNGASHRGHAAQRNRRSRRHTVSVRVRGSRRTDVPRSVHRRRFRSAARFRLFAVAHRKSDSRTIAGLSWQGSFRHIC